MKSYYALINNAFIEITFMTFILNKSLYGFILLNLEHSTQTELPKFIYRTHAIITRGLYLFYLIFTAVYVVERLILQRG